MKTPVTRICIAIASIAFMALQPAFADSDTDELEQVRIAVSAMFDEIDPEHIQPSPIDGWYTVRKGAIVAYTARQNPAGPKGLNESNRSCQQGREGVEQCADEARPAKESVECSPRIHSLLSTSGQPATSLVHADRHRHPGATRDGPVSNIYTRDRAIEEPLQPQLQRN